MKSKKFKNTSTFTLPAIFKEVKQTVSVFLNETGIQALKGTHYLRDNSYIACSRVLDDAGAHYLMVQVRYYREEANLPKYAYLAVPHSYVKYMSSERPFHEENAFVKFGSAKKN